MDIIESKKKLGFGLMRLPLTDLNDDGSIDIAQSKKMVDMFIKRGFTYFDTAWMYCNFKSEEAVKEILTSRYSRDKYTLATKLHAGYLNEKDDRDKIFNAQINKTGVEYFDYYLLHNMGGDLYDIYKKFDCFSWLKLKKEQGKIKHIGFSFHDSAEILDQILTEHPEMEFVQLQINYLDWNSDAIQSRKCYEIAVKHGKPVIVMEPVKGGTLAHLPIKTENEFKKYRPNMSIPSWAIRFAASLDNVKIVLSGMSSLEQVDDNTSYMKNFIPFDKNEKKLVKESVDLLNESISIQCTGCSYCTAGCPVNIPIPKYFSLYNTEKQEMKGKTWTPQEAYYDRLADRFGKASDCIECGQCERICPQHLPVRKLLKEVVACFEKDEEKE